MKTIFQALLEYGEIYAAATHAHSFLPAMEHCVADCNSSWMGVVVVVRIFHADQPVQPNIDLMIANLANYYPI